MLLRVSRVAAVLAGVVGSVGAAQAQFEQIVGDALRVEVSAGARSGMVAISRSELVPTGEFFQWAWSSAAPVEVFDGMGGLLGTFSGQITYDTQFDNIFFSLAFVAGSEDARFAVRSAGLAESFTGGFDALMVRATLRDLNSDGATMAGLLGGLFARVEWNGETQIAGLAGFSAPVGGSASSSVDLMAPALPFAGSKVVRAEFSLTAQDSLSSTLESITSIPGPGAPVLLALAGLARWRRRGRA